MLDLHSIRAKNAALLAARGFRVADWLPLRGRDEIDLRPRNEIVLRLAALNAVYVYVMGRKSCPEPALREMIRDHGLDAAMTASERDILNIPREDSHDETIGWLTENILPLAWALGHAHEPGIDGAMLDLPAIKPLCTSFAPTTSAACAALLAATSLRPVAEVVELEDLFYCCHNAVRSAQFNDPSCVPGHFDPIANGGVIAERRHALTWMLSPNVDWEDTDLST
jgi:Domain of unknown function (DUF4272)